MQLNTARDIHTEMYIHYIRRRLREGNQAQKKDAQRLHIRDNLPSSSILSSRQGESDGAPADCRREPVTGFG